MAPRRHVALVGPTASGKSALAHRWAVQRDDFEIVSVDSMQVYRGMDIGTAKPTLAEQAAVPYHLIDLVAPSEEFTLSDFQAAARACIGDIERRGRRALLVGGTGLYLRAVTENLALPGRYPEVAAQLDQEPDVGLLYRRLVELDDVAASRMEPTNRRRVLRALEVCIGSGRRFSSYGPGLDHHPEIDVTLVGVDRPRAELDERIADRYRDQLAAGFLTEVAAVFGADPPPSRTARQALGYKELAATFAGELSVDDAVALAITRTRRFARRQQRWFRRDPRIRWLDPAENPLVALDALRGDCPTCN
ncbi:MAG: tRNA (adenosine(37)-N6)-dimethylallyltransferase MiaA [Acidimicrobiia bacterium]|nr:tRNA (adenosine(37)-N6)-dimethylallyltransferase MiaA [Acidimicrobiia bacterium]